MYFGLHVKYPLFLSDFNQTWFFFPQIFEISSNIKFLENPSSGSRVLWRQTDRQTDGHLEAIRHFSQFCACI